MPAGLWVVLCACQAAPGGGAWVQGRHFTAFGGRGGVLRAGGDAGGGLVDPQAYVIQVRLLLS